MERTSPPDPRAPRRAVVIGAGFAGIAAAATLARHGFAVEVLEKNDGPGGRAGVWREGGFTFDMGPSFYWMPEVFERFFAAFGTQAREHYELRRLDPSYRIVFGPGNELTLPASREAQRQLFESLEPGAAAASDRYLAEARVKYDLGMGDLVYRPSLSWLEYAHLGMLRGLLRTTVFRSLRSHVADHFTDHRLRSLMEFPALFLGATPQRTPALYSLMNHADLELGTWYPSGGMGRVVEAMVRVAEGRGARFHYRDPVARILVDQGRIAGVETMHRRIGADVVIGAADYHHVEQELLPAGSRQYTEGYWAKRRLAPSSLLFFLGCDLRLPRLEHHTLFFDEPLDAHAAEIHDRPRWPSRPLFYASCPSRTDPSVAPPGHECLTLLIPIAPGLNDDERTRERYYGIVMQRLERYLGIDLRPHVVVKRSYCINDLVADHNAFGGNAYGLANTLTQTGPLRPRMKSSKVKGLYFAGQLTVPGPGVPPAIISGQVAGKLAHHETRSATTAQRTDPA